jgi:hypothetical protein
MGHYCMFRRTMDVSTWCAGCSITARMSTREKSTATFHYSGQSTRANSKYAECYLNTMLMSMPGIRSERFHFTRQRVLRNHRDQLKIMQLLLDHGADVNARDNDGCTPLHHSSYWEKGHYHPGMGTVEGSRLLLEHGAIIDAKNNEGKTALQVALQAGRHEMAEFLSAWGAPPCLQWHSSLTFRSLKRTLPPGPSGLSASLNFPPPRRTAPRPQSGRTLPTPTAIAWALSSSEPGATSFLGSGTTTNPHTHRYSTPRAASSGPYGSEPWTNSSST